MSVSFWRSSDRPGFWRSDRLNTTIEQELRQGRAVITRTTGVSMKPLLSENRTYIVIEPLRGELCVGDIPVWRRPDGVYIVHRLVQMEGDICFTRGDNCLHAEKVPMDRILGRVTQIRRKNRTIFTVGDMDPAYRFYVRFWEKSWGLRRRYFLARERLKKIVRFVRRGKGAL